MIRTLEQLTLAGETPETLKAALEAHERTRPEAATSEAAAWKWLQRLGELVEERAIMQGWGEHRP